MPRQGTGSVDREHGVITWWLARTPAEFISPVFVSFLCVGEERSTAIGDAHVMLARATAPAAQSPSNLMSSAQGAGEF